MYPTYSGMNSIVYDEETAPGKLSKIISKLTLGARHYKVTANNSGEIELLFAKVASISWGRCKVKNKGDSKPEKSQSPVLQ